MDDKEKDNAGSQSSDNQSSGAETTTTREVNIDRGANANQDLEHRDQKSDKYADNNSEKK